MKEIFECYSVITCVSGEGYSVTVNMGWKDRDGGMEKDFTSKTVYAVDWEEVIPMLQQERDELLKLYVRE